MKIFKFEDPYISRKWSNQKIRYVVERSRGGLQLHFRWIFCAAEIRITKFYENLPKPIFSNVSTWDSQAWRNIYLRTFVVLRWFVVQDSKFLPSSFQNVSVLVHSICSLKDMALQNWLKFPNLKAHISDVLVFSKVSSMTTTSFIVNVL